MPRFSLSFSNKVVFKASFGALSESNKIINDLLSV